MLFTASLHAYLKVSGDEILIAGQSAVPVSVPIIAEPGAWACRMAPGTLSKLTGTPSPEFSGHTLHAHDLNRAARAGLRGMLHEYPSVVRMAGAVRRVMLASASLQERRHRAILRETTLAVRRNPNVRAEDLADDFGYTGRQFRRIIRGQSGFNVRTLIRLVRFDRVKSILRARLLGDDMQWVEFATAAGYYDQSHFIRAFKEFTSLTPSQFSALMSDSSNTWA